MKNGLKGYSFWCDIQQQNPGTCAETTFMSATYWNWCERVTCGKLSTLNSELTAYCRYHRRGGPPHFYVYRVTILDSELHSIWRGNTRTPCMCLHQELTNCNPLESLAVSHGCSIKRWCLKIRGPACLTRRSVKQWLTCTAPVTPWWQWEDGM